MNIQSKKYLFRDKIKLYLQYVSEAISGSEQDFTEGRLSRAIVLLAIPSILEMIMESVFVIVDIWFVSKLGPDAVATVGLTESLLTIIYAIALGLGAATTSMVSRRIGEKDNDAASVTAFQAIITGFVLSLIIGITGGIMAPTLLKTMGASATIVNELSGYARIMLYGNSMIMLLFIINAIFRSAGDAAVAMKVLWLGNIINLILDPCLIFGLGPFPELGIHGAAVATTTGRGIAVLVQFYLLIKGKKRISLSLRHLVVDFKIIGRILKLSVGSIGQNLIGTSSWIALVRIISMFGNEVVAGYTIAIRIIGFVLLPSWGLSNAASTLVGQNLGAKKPDRAEKAVWVTGITNMIALGLVGAVMVFVPEPFIRFFITDEAVVRSGVLCLWIVSLGFISYGLGMVLSNSFNGAGDTSTPLKINIMAYWLVEIPLAWFLSVSAGMEEKGVFISIVVAETLLTITSFIVFRRGKWKLKEV